MKLLQFRVKEYRSVADSTWITCDDVTTLVGVNEAGKSNLLRALWQLNPAKGGEINLLADMPRRIYSTARNEPDAYTFSREYRRYFGASPTSYVAALRHPA